MDSMQKSFDNSTAYYRDILQPVYTPQCGWDLDNVTYTLTNVFNGKEEDRWVIGCKLYMF